MKYKQIIADYFNSFVCEEQVAETMKKYQEWKPFGYMEFDRFNKMFNTFIWLVKYDYYYINIEMPITKPTNEEIKDAMMHVKFQGEHLLEYAKKHPDKIMRKDLIKLAHKKIDCAEYYVNLADEDFFNDKNLKYNNNATITQLEE